MQAKLLVIGTAAALAGLVLLAGCEKPLCHCNAQTQPVTYEPQTVDPWLVEASSQLSVEKAVVRQHTLFPYQFVEYGAALNELGRRDLDILIRHYKQYPGPLNIRQGEAPDQLYQARVATVRDAMQCAGVNVQQVNVADGPVGGDGLAGDHVLVILKTPHETSAANRTVSVAPVTIQESLQDSMK